MTAASGILHDEFHSPKFTREGGTLEMVQLWVNLPAKDKMTAPKYQEISDRDIPTVGLPKHAGRVRVIAGNYQGYAGPADTHTPMDVWDVRLNAGSHTEFSFVEGRTTALVLLRGDAAVNGASMQAAQLMLLERTGEDIAIAAELDSTVLILSGEPIDEPIVGQGPFVMNTQDEIRQAFSEFSSGKFGRIEN